MHGFDWNDGGINNQKYAVLGLFAAAADGVSQDERTLYLPRMFSRDQHQKNDSQHDFSEVFWVEPIKELASRWGIQVAETPLGVEYADRIERGGWRYFYRGIAAVEALGRLDAADSLPADFFRNLRPKVTSSKTFQKLAKGIFGDTGIEVATQLRIEEDWAHHSEYHVKPSALPNEEFYAPAERIIAKVKNTLVETPSTIFVSCDEKYIFAPKWEIAEKVKADTGIQIVFKSDILSSEDFAELRPIDASLIDFELAKMSKVFVGLSRSTFANLVAFERFAGAYGDRHLDYVYNLPGEVCGRRTDRGIHHDPQKATA